MAVEQSNCDLIRKLKKKGRVTSKEKLMNFFNIAMEDSNIEMADLLYSSLIKEKVKEKYPDYYKQKQIQKKVGSF